MSPELRSHIEFNNYFNKENNVLSDIFSIGLIILYCLPDSEDYECKYKNVYDKGEKYILDNLEY